MSAKLAAFSFGATLILIALGMIARCCARRDPSGASPCDASPFSDSMLFDDIWTRAR